MLCSSVSLQRLLFILEDGHQFSLRWVMLRGHITHSHTQLGGGAVGHTLTSESTEVKIHLHVHGHSQVPSLVSDERRKPHNHD